MLADIGAYLEEQGVGTVGEDLFLGYFPEAPDDCVVLLETQGLPPDAAAGTETPGLQAVARWKSAYSYAEGKLQRIHDVLKQVGFEDGDKPSGVTIGGRQYFSVYPEFSGMEALEDDETGRKRIARNYFVVMRG